MGKCGCRENRRCGSGFYGVYRGLGYGLGYGGYGVYGGYGGYGSCRRRCRSISSRCGYGRGYGFGYGYGY